MKLNLITHKARMLQQIELMKHKANNAKSEAQRKALEHKITEKRNELNSLWRKYLLN